MPPSTKRMKKRRSQLPGTGDEMNAKREGFRPSRANEIAIALCVYGALRILIFSAAFPFFNNLDEVPHFASIEMYAQGNWPGKKLPHYDSETARLFALFASPEYLQTEEQIEQSSAQSNLRLPLYRVPKEKLSPYLPAIVSHYSEGINYEAQAPPLYYLMGAVWLRIGSFIGLQDWALLYWVKFLNPGLYALLVWLSYCFTRTVYPERPFLWIAAPALIAVFPQDVFFGLNRDILSAPLAALALWWMLRGISEKTEKPSRWLVAASFMVGLAFLTNVSNCVLYVALACALWTWSQSQKKWAAKIRILITCSAAAVVLPLAWMARNFAVMGDFTGSRAKIEYLGWTVKPVALWLDHPLFSFHGVSFFIWQLTRTFWRGEYAWHLASLQWLVADWFYVLSSLAFLAASVGYFLKDQKNLSAVQRFASIQGMVMILGSVAFMALISLPFDFHESFYPSRQLPFFISGRIIVGAMLPFALLYVGTLERILIRFSFGWRVTILIGILCFATFAEVKTHSLPFSSSFNFYALCTWRPGQ